MTDPQSRAQELWGGGPPDVQFTQRERRGVFLGRSAAQLILAGAAIGMTLIAAILVGFENLLWLLPITTLVVAVAVWSWRGTAVLTLIARSIAFTRRRSSGQTRFVRGVWWRDAGKEIPAGETVDAAVAPVVFHHQVLPGGLGDLAFVDIPGRGGFVLNKKEQLAAVTLRVLSSAWALRDEGRKEQTYTGFAGWMSSLESMPGLEEVALRVRVDRAAATELADYVAARDEVRDTEISNALKQEYDALIRQEASRSMEFTNLITVVFDVNKVSAAVRDAGGGLAGIAAFLTDQVQTMTSGVDDLDVRFDAWLDAEQLEGIVQGGLDPVTVAERRERFGAGRDELRSRPAVMDGEESRDTVQMGRSTHQTLWIHEWPRTKAKTGFLQRVLYTGEATRCLTLQFRPVPLHKALNDLASAQIDMNTAAAIRERWGGRTSVQHVREHKNLDEREQDLADGFTDERFRGFLTITGSDRAEVRRDRAALEQAGFGSGLRLAVLTNQQWPALVTGVLPVPTRLGKGQK